ncbi:NADH-ubiquinone oxidoreductase 21 kDa subunit [Yarrowia sp. B02]|nr:NADH-ubiquinone oxidoreductase 21 kDa subunit [Yarrowia sp. B02]
MLSRSLRQLSQPSVRSFATSARLLQKKDVPEVGVNLDNVPAHEIVSGAPAELSRNRVVRIYQQAKPATQSGEYGTFAWRLDWDIVDRANRWENDLIGWQSSGDYMQATQMKFTSKESAIRFANKQGWDFYIQEPHHRKFRVKQYANNFVHSYGKLKHIRTK